MLSIKFIKTTLLSCFILLSCNRFGDGKATISGQLTGAADEKLLLLRLGPGDLERIDSTHADSKGAFSFTLTPNETDFYLVQDAAGKVLAIILGKNDHITVKGEFTDFPYYTKVEGSKENLLLQQFFEFTRRNEQKVDSLELILSDAQEEPNYYQITQQLDTAFKAIWEQQRAFEKQFIDQHAGSLASLIVLNYAFGMNPVLSPLDDSLYYLKVDSALMPLYPNNRHVQHHHQRIPGLTQRSKR